MSAPTTLRPSEVSRPAGSGVWLLRVLGSSVVLVVVLAGAGTLVAGFFQRQVVATDVLTAGTRSVVVDGDIGDVSVRRSLSGEQARVVRTSQWSFDQAQSSVAQSGGAATVTSRCAPSVGLNLCSVDVLVVLPPGAAVQVRTTTGDVSLTRLDSSVVVDSTTGDVSGRQLEASQVTVHSGVGDVSLSFRTAPSSVTAQATTGDVTVAVPTDDTYRVSARTTAGDRSVRVPLADDATRTITASSTAGDVAVIARSG